MAAIVDVPASTSRAEERRVRFDGFSWQRFEQLTTCFLETTSVRLAFIEGSVEIMSPIGQDHEHYKRTLGLLLETLCQVRGIRYYERSESLLLPSLDIDLLVSYLILPDQYDAVRAFRNALA